MANKSQEFDITKSKGRALLQWANKQPLQKVEYYPAQEKEAYGNAQAQDWNKLFWGDNLQVLAHLLKEYRGKVDLIYIDPPFDSKADYVKKVKIRGQQVQGVQQGLLEEKQYTDIWENDEYLQFMYERLQLLRELLSDQGSIYLHCDWHKNSYLRIIMDEVFGEDNFVNEVVWSYRSGGASKKESLARKHDTILLYRKTAAFEVNTKYERQYLEKAFMGSKQDEKGRHYADTVLRDNFEGIVNIVEGNKIVEYNTRPPLNLSNERTNYPTQKPEGLLKLLIEVASKPGAIVLDCFIGSGTTAIAAQETGRHWIGCDINIGAIQTTTKRLNQILDEQKKQPAEGALDGFKVYNVNNYDIFKNELEAKDVVMDIYGVEQIKGSAFDGVRNNNFVQVLPLNRILSKMDVELTLKLINDNLSLFTAKPSSTQAESLFEQGVEIICSGAEIDAHNYLKTRNNTGVEVTILDIQRDKAGLVFKRKPEASMAATVDSKQLTVTINQFHSPILMQKLELENAKLIDQQQATQVEDFKQIVDTVAIDVNYDGMLFNAEIIDVPGKNELIAGSYEYAYDKAGTYTVAIKIVDVLGEEYFDTAEVVVKWPS